MGALLSCLVVGCGYVGRRLVRRESTRRPLLAVVRSATNAAALEAAGVPVLTADFDDATPGPVLAAADAAAVVYLVPPPEAGTTDPRLERFLARLGDTRPAVVVYVSTTGVYGDTGGALVDERSPLAPANDRARRRMHAETTVAHWCATRGVRCVVLRVPGIYGPHRLPLERLERREPVLRPEDAGPGNRIHVDDLVTTVLAAVDSPDACGAYNVTDGDAASTTAYLQALAAAAGLPPPALVSKADAAKHVSPGMLAYLLESRRVDNRRLREELGVRLAYADLGAGLRASLDEMHAEAAS